MLEEALPHLPRLRRYARLLTGDAARADDLLQDTLERAARKQALWRPELGGADRSGALRAWLLTLMHRHFLNQLRDQRQHLYEEYMDEHAPAHDPQPQWQQRLDLERALAALPAPAREVLLLVCVEELSYEDAARVLELPVGTVMSRLSRARERLRQLMHDEQPAAGAALRVVK
ncbi:RNA polymerase sigma factor [Paucibacter soli]